MNATDTIHYQFLPSTQILLDFYSHEALQLPLWLKPWLLSKRKRDGFG